jgi:two-component system LytT family response regulator
VTIRAIIVDHEPLMRRKILRLLTVHPTVQVVAECGDGGSATRSMVQHVPDLIFLDLQIPGLDGIEALSRIRAGPMPLMVLTTAYPEYAAQGLEARAVETLLKPFGQQRFNEALSRVTQQRLAVPPAPCRPAPTPIRRTQHLERFSVQRNGRVFFVKADEVDWIEAEKNYALLHIGTAVEVIRTTLNSLEQTLNPNRFVRIHRSTIVNRSKVREIVSWFNGYHIVVLETGQQLRMSRYQQESMRILKDGTNS